MQRWLFVTMLLCGTFVMTCRSANGEGPRFEVTITNLTRGQVFTPILAASHKAGTKLFTLGQAASAPLEMIAEAGDVGPLAAALSSMSSVHDVASSGAPLLPGHSVVLTLRTIGEFDHISVTSMLVPTNDGFFALNDEAGPKGAESITIYSPAYDAGTEANDELCSHIPGPPGVCAGEAFSASRDDPAGYVHIHSGIHGGGDLVPASRDWRNPVARITVHRVP